MVYPNYTTFTVVDVIASFVPQKFLTFLGDANPHTEGIETSRFCEVTNVESNFLLFKLGTAVLNAVIKPLVMASCVGVNPHVKVVLIWPHLCHHVQIATLEKGVEFKFLV